jgi:hypothetical protein
MALNKYSPDQWAFMNLPVTQGKILRDLRSSVTRFLDTAPEKALILRASAILEILRHYFEAQLERAGDDPYERATSEEVLIGLSTARRRMRTDEVVEREIAELLALPPMTDEELDRKVKEWEALESRLKKEGLEHWWD